MRRLPIRTKLAVALAVPLLALVAVTVLEVAKTSSEVDDVREQTELAQAAIGPSGIITALQNERTWLAVELIGQQDGFEVPVRGYDETRSQTDEAISSFRDDIESGSATVREVFQEPLAGLDALAEVRADIDGSTAPRSPDNIEFAGEIFDRYTELIRPFFTATTRISLAVDDPTLRQGTELADAAAREIEALSILLRTVIVDSTLSAGGIDESAEIARIATLHSDFESYADALRNGTGPYARLVRERYPEALVASVNEQIDSALTTGRVDLGTVLAAVNVPRDQAFTGYQDGLHGLILDRAEDLQSAAENRRVWFGALAMLALGVAVVLTWLVSRSITRPLRSLTEQAKEMASHRLPDAVLDILETPLGDDVDVPEVEPITVRTHDEVSDVADALNTVQDSALDLAVEQAVLRRNIADSFVNLGRRNQNLLGRQLDFITELESNETDPDTLASLFRLDHLATRMRRNAESLLVLAGIEPPRKWAAPVRITDVIRAALGEVEDYQRVTIRGVEPATILGSAAADLAHLLAEFVENALTFSPPDQKVEVRGRRNHQDGYSLAVIDQGFGMPETDIAQANRRLSGTESFTIAPSKYLGHYVAGNLAARHGIRLQLSNTPGHQGITAAIELPGSLLTTEAPVGDPITDPHGNRAIAANAAKAKAGGAGRGGAAGASGSPGSSGGEPGAVGPGGPGGFGGFGALAGAPGGADGGPASPDAGGWGAGLAGDAGANPVGFAAGAPPFSAGPGGLVAPTGAAGRTDVGSGPPGGAAGGPGGGRAPGRAGAVPAAGLGGPGLGTDPGADQDAGGDLPDAQDGAAGRAGGQNAGAGLAGGPGAGTGPSARQGAGGGLAGGQDGTAGLGADRGAGAGFAAGDRGVGPGAGAAFGGRPAFGPDPADTAGAGAAPFGAGPGPNDPASAPGRTPSGLVKRARRGSESAAGRTSGTMPTGGLLAALSTHTSRLGSQRRLQQLAGGPAPDAGPGSPGRPALPSRFGDAPAVPGSPPGPAGLAGDPGGSPGRPALPSRRSPGGDQPPAPPAPGFPASGPGQAGPGTAPSPGPAPGAGAAARHSPAGGPGFPGGPSGTGAPAPGPGLPGGPGPSGPGLTGSPGPTPGSGLPGGAGPRVSGTRSGAGSAGDIRSGEWAPPPGPLFGPPGPGDRSSDAVAAFLNSGATQAVPPTVGRSTPSGPPPGPRPDPGSGGTTRSGLARRVRGAQMPSTQPVSLRRRDQADGSTGGEPAKDVYSFLSNFTAGVQRGLDEARRSAPPEEK